ncbi:EpsG family protein [Geobacillus jurassicus]|uniref:EpsG family protein n=1 Tax=Geobacillus jurassicus TaxID=235932 RepID=A0ABV6GQQ0_9BACL|nr:EpsG family protein [Geobacillus jurassicus]
MIYLFMFTLTSFLFYPLKVRCNNSKEKLILSLLFLIPTFLILVLFVGLRFDVGRDYGIYYNIFYLGYGANKEIGFRLINDIFSKLGFELSSVLVLMAFLSLYFAFKIIRNQGKHSFMSFVIFWLDGAYIYLFNVVRQGLTNIIFLNIIEKFREKRIILMVLLILFSSLFHYSIFLAVLFIPFLMRRYSKKTLLFMFVLVILANFLFNIQDLSIKMLHFVPYFGDIYSETNLLENNVKREEFGLGYLFRFILVFIAILNYDKIAQDVKVQPFLNAFVFWGILKILTLQVWIAERLLDYLRFSSIIIVPRLIESIENKKIRFLFTAVILIIYFALFLKSTVFSSYEEKLVPYKWIFSK